MRWDEMGWNEMGWDGILGELASVRAYKCAVRRTLLRFLSLNEEAHGARRGGRGGRQQFLDLTHEGQTFAAHIVYGLALRYTE